jgi:hypothetical protein
MPQRPFQATHVIPQDDGAFLFLSALEIPGPAYTKEEWEEYEIADREIQADGTLTFQGEITKQCEEIVEAYVSLQVYFIQYLRNLDPDNDSVVLLMDKSDRLWYAMSEEQIQRVKSDRRISDAMKTIPSIDS